MDLKRFVVFMSMVFSLGLLFTIERIVQALYFHGDWTRACMGILFSALLLVPFVLGVRDVRRAGEQEQGAPNVRSELWAVVSSLCFAFLTIPFLMGWWERLHINQIAMAFKATYTVLTLVYCCAAVLNLLFSVRRWQHARQQARQNEHPAPTFPV